jgi:hypothetical protein
MKPSGESIAGVLVEAARLYLALGAVVAVGVHWRGLRRIDPATGGSGIGFRVLITPGLVALWPWLLVVWFRAVRRPGFHGGAVVSPRLESLRGVQSWAWKALGILVPAALGLLLLSRPSDAPPSRLPESSSNAFSSPVP